VAPLDWRRPLGAAAHASALLQLHGDALDAIGRFAASGDAVTLRGSAQCQDGRIVLVRLDRVALGRTQMGGTVSFPARPRAGPIAVRLDGPVLDLAARLARPRAGRHPPSPEPAPGPPWTLDARFERVVAAHGYLLAPLRVHAEDDGVVLRSLQVDGFTGDKAPFALQIAPEAGGRRLTATAAKGGDLLRALDVTDTIYDGALTLSGRY